MYYLAIRDIYFYKEYGPLSHSGRKRNVHFPEFNASFPIGYFDDATMKNSCGCGFLLKLIFYTFL